MSAEAQMRLLGEHDGVRWYWAAPGMFHLPGVYYWDGGDNVRVEKAQPAPSPQPAVPVVEAFAEGWRMAADWANRDDLLPDMDSPQYAKERDERLAELRPSVEPMTLPPVEGDVLPAIGSKVLIHLASSDSWAEHEVVGYYVWEAINDLAKPRHHRVFVRVRDADGILNARHICDVRGITTKAEGGA